MMKPSEIFALLTEEEHTWNDLSRKALAGNWWIIKAKKDWGSDTRHLPNTKFTSVDDPKLRDYLKQEYPTTGVDIYTPTGIYYFWNPARAMIGPE